MHNSLVTSIAPTGTISLFADNVSSGIEPVFAYSYTRNVLLPDGRRAPEQVVDYAFRRHQDMFGPDAPLPESFVDAQGLRPADDARIQPATPEHGAKIARASGGGRVWHEGLSSGGARYYKKQTKKNKL